MNLTTKFDLGQKVWGIVRDVKKGWRKCPACDGSGTISCKDDEHYSCPRCRGNRGEYHGGTTIWRIDDATPSAIGWAKAAAATTEPIFQEEYMLKATGCPYGICWQVSHLFPSEAEALAGCERRNAEAKTAEVAS